MPCDAAGDHGHSAGALGCNRVQRVCRTGITAACGDGDGRFVFSDVASVRDAYTGSMEPTLLVGDKILAGDRIRVTHKQLFRNGMAIRKAWVQHAMEYEDSYRDNFPAEPNEPLYQQSLEMLGSNAMKDGQTPPFSTLRWNRLLRLLIR
jgi:hypothetical protein